MKIESKEKMLEKIATGKYCIVKSTEYCWDHSQDVTKWYIASGRGQNMNMSPITEERAKEWLALGAELIYL